MAIEGGDSGEPESDTPDGSTPRENDASPLRIYASVGSDVAETVASRDILNYGEKKKMPALSKLSVPIFLPDGGLLYVQASDNEFDDDTAYVGVKIIKGKNIINARLDENNPYAILNYEGAKIVATLVKGKGRRQEVEVELIPVDAIKFSETDFQAALMSDDDHSAAELQTSVGVIPQNLVFNERSILTPGITYLAVISEGSGDRINIFLKHRDEVFAFIAFHEGDLIIRDPQNFNRFSPLNSGEHRLGIKPAGFVLDDHSEEYQIGFRINETKLGLFEVEFTDKGSSRGNELQWTNDASEEQTQERIFAPEKKGTLGWVVSFFRRR